MTTQPSVRDFLKIFLPFLMTLAIGRLISQTDLIMLSRVGPEEAAAFGVPMRIMVLDMIAAFAMAPVISVMIASELSLEGRRAQVQSCLKICLLAGLTLSGIGFIVYPILVDWIIADLIIRNLAKTGVFWLTFSIPIRLLQFGGAMAAHGMGLGRRVVFIQLGEFFMNFGLNALLIFKLGLGFEGAYLSTFLCSVVSLGLTLYLLRKDLLGLQARLPNGAWVRNFFRQIALEISRVSSERIAALVLLTLFSQGSLAVNRLGVFSAGMELLFFLSVPTLAAMRASSILLAPIPQPFRTQVLSLLPIVRVLFPITLICSLLLLFFGPMLGSKIYVILPAGQPWWRGFIYLLAFLIPLKLLDGLLRGIWNSRKDFGTSLKTDVFTHWSILVPGVAIGLAMDSPAVTWGSYAVAEGAGFLILLVKGSLRTAA